MGNKHIAILVFSRTANAESKHKRLANTLSKSEELATQMIKHTKGTVNAAELPYFIISEDQQRGANFGEKIANAFQDIFSKGYKNVIAIGNDCLSLSALDIIYAADVLRKNKAVAGPTQDGGTYLIGMNDSAFDFDQFKNIKWQSTSTYDGLLDYFINQAITPITLDYKADIDTISDWKIGLLGVKIQLKNRILTILKRNNSFQPNIDFSYTNTLTELSSSLRGPPRY